MPKDLGHCVTHCSKKVLLSIPQLSQSFVAPVPTCLKSIARINKNKHPFTLMLGWLYLQTEVKTYSVLFYLCFTRHPNIFGEGFLFRLSNSLPAAVWSSWTPSLSSVKKLHVTVQYKVFQWLLFSYSFTDDKQVLEGLDFKNVHLISETHTWGSKKGASAWYLKQEGRLWPLYMHDIIMLKSLALNCNYWLIN